MDRLCGTAACYAQVKPAQPGRADGPRRWCHALGAIIAWRACPGRRGGASVGARLWTECGKALGSSTTAKRWLCQAIGLKAGLTEEVGRQWGGGKLSAQRRFDGGRLRWGGGSLRGGPTARGRGEGGAGATSEQEEKHGVRGGI
jgi:hypothetical protein